MPNVYLLALLLCIASAYLPALVFAQAQTAAAGPGATAPVEPTTVASAVDEVTVYRSGALVVRRGTVTLSAGEQTVRFPDLETGIDGASVQLDLDDGASVFSLTAALDPRAATAEPPRVLDLRTRLDSLALAANLLAAEEAGYTEELATLAANRDLAGGEAGATTVEEIRRAADFTRERVTEVRGALARLTVAKRDLAERRKALKDEISGLRPDAPDYVSQVTARILADAPGIHAFELSYLVGDASWTPDYDLYVDPAVQDEASLVLVGNVTQATGADWTDVAATLSTGDPSRRTSAPELRPWRIGDARSSRASTAGSVRYGAYTASPTRIRGTVRDEYGEELIGANVVIVGTDVGVATDFDGHYELDVPREGARGLRVSFAGYETLTADLRSATIDFTLDAGPQLEEVVVVGYGDVRSPRRKSAQASNREADLAPAPSLTFATVADQLQTRTYRLDRPLTLPPDGQSRAVRLQRYTLPLALAHRVVSAAEPVAYLQGTITGWDTLGLSSGVARLHLDGRYLGTTQLSTSQTDDSLTVGLGVDERVVVRRRLLDRQSDRKVIRGHIHSLRSYAVEVRNTHPYAVDVTLVEQVPLSAREEIDVELGELSGGTVDGDTGELTWTFDLAPAERVRKVFTYEIQRPR